MILGEITGRSLDGLVEQARTVNERGASHFKSALNLIRLSKIGSWLTPRYSSNWKAAGALLDKEKMSLAYCDGQYTASLTSKQHGILAAQGSTGPQAIARLYVLNTFGEYFSSSWWFGQPAFVIPPNFTKNISLSVSMLILSYRMYLTRNYFMLAVGMVLASLLILHVNRQVRTMLYGCRRRLDEASWQAHSVLKNKHDSKGS